MAQDSFSVMQTFGAYFSRELTLCVRQPSDLLNSLVFFVLVVVLFPFGVSPEGSVLHDIAAGVIWIAALLAVLLSLERLFRQDFREGTLEQFILSGQPLFVVMAAKLLVHWLLTGLPLVLVSPLLGMMMHYSSAEIGVLMLSLMIGTPGLCVVGAIGAALTINARQSGVLVPLVILPLTIPILIFGAGALKAASAGLDFAGALSMLGAISLFLVLIAPFVTALASKLSLSS